MEIASPLVNIRAPSYPEKAACCDFVTENWGREAAERCHGQFVEYFKGGLYAPVFMVAVDEQDKPIGFAAYHRTMQCTWNIIWLGVGKSYEGQGIGSALVAECLKGIEANGGMLVEVITQKKDFYRRFGFDAVNCMGKDWHLLLKQLGEFGL